jgi:hypothetical protein
MSRSRTRERRRRARTEELRAEFSKSRDDARAFAALLTRLSDSDTPIWPIAEAASRAKPLDDAERAMVAQAVAPHLTGKTPGSVRRRQAMGTVSQVSSIKPSG